MHYLQTNGANYVDNSYDFLLHPGTTITIVNNDVVSHTFVSGVSNSNTNASIDSDYDTLCQFVNLVKK